MKTMKIGSGGFSLGGSPTLGKGGASRYAPYPAPAGLRWDFVTEDGRRVTEDAVPVVDLVRR